MWLAAKLRLLLEWLTLPLLLTAMQLPQVSCTSWCTSAVHDCAQACTCQVEHRAVRNSRRQHFTSMVGLGFLIMDGGCSLEA